MGCVLARSLQLPEQRADLRGLERLAPVARVVEEPAPGLGAKFPPRDLLLDQARWLEPVVAERLGEEAARTVEDVHAAPVDELEDPDLRVPEAHPRPERPVDVLGRRNSPLEVADRLCTERRLLPRADEAGRVGQANGGFTGGLETFEGAVDDGGAGGVPGAD